MSFFKKLLGGTFESNKEEGEYFLSRESWGEAKLSFDRALSRAKNAPTEQVEQVRELVMTCKIELARRQISNADEEFETGDFETALDLLKDALEICDAAEIADMVEGRRRDYDAKEARRLRDDSTEISEDELRAVIAGTWSGPQIQEFHKLPDSAMHAMIAAHDGDIESAHTVLEEAISESELNVKPRFAWLELARLRARGENWDEALTAFDEFLARTAKDADTADSRVIAMIEKTRVLMRLERFDDAKEQVLEATRFAPQDYSVFLFKGVFFRQRENLDGSYKALLKAADLMGTLHPDFSVIRELGMTCLAMGRKGEAKGHLKAVIEHQASQAQHGQFDPETALALASLQEEDGDFAEAADLFRHLAVGHDTSNHFLYNLQAARLLVRVGKQTDLASRYLSRSEELAETEDDWTALDAVRGQLG